MSEEKPWKDALNLDQALQAPARIAILLFLLPRSTATFSTVQNALNLTAGNLSSHLKKLEQSNYIIIDKQFIEDKPTTTVTISSLGHRNLVNYISSLNSALQNES